MGLKEPYRVRKPQHPHTALALQRGAYLVRG